MEDNNAKKITFSTEQENTIKEDINNILVAAAAGSGKTTVLVERIIRSICEGKLSVDRLLVVTFTNDAANNMANKIEKAIRKRMDEARAAGEDDLAAMLSDQLDLLPNAYIQTIDSFCSRVLKEKGYVAGVDEEADVFSSGNVILDENNLDIILNQAAKLALMEMYDKDGEDGSAFIRLTRRYGDGRKDDSLILSLKNVYRALRSLPDYCDKIDEMIVERRKADASGTVPAIEQVIEDIRVAFDRLYPAIAAWESDCDAIGIYPLKAKKKGMIGNVNEDDAKPLLFGNFKQYVEDVLAALNDDSLSCKEKYEAVLSIDLLNEVFDAGILKGITKLSGADANPDSVALSRACAAAGAVMDLLKNRLPKLPSGYATFSLPYKLPNNYKDILARDYDSYLGYQVENTEMAAAFVELLKLCDKYYAKLKASVHGSDFADQEYGAYEVLKDPDAAEFYRNKFIEIYIDEYQDNSALQDAIIGCFARDEGNVFRVGDIKQSIYRFRNADPDLFNGHLKKLKATPKEEKGELFLLNENHRSSRQILDFVNFIFGQIMTEEGAEIDYDEGQKLNPAKDSPNDNIPRVVVVDRLAEFWKDCDIGAEVSEEDEETESEAEGSEQSDDGKLSVSEKARRQKLALCFGVYKEIRNYLDEDKSHKREDICVLTKTVSKGKMIAEFLKSLGIKCVSDNKTKIFEDMHIQSVMNLIILLGNEYRDEYLMSVMLRNFRFTNFTLDDLATINVFIRNNQKKYSSANLMVRIRVFCDTAEDSELKTRLNDFLDVFDDLRMTSRVGDIDDLVDRIYSESGVMANVISEDNIGVAKLVLLKDWLSSNFKRYGTDIGTVAAKLEEMRHTFNSDASFSSRDTDSDAVTFMSIHKSKGLEFPFVVLAFDDGQENNDSMGNIIFDKTNGFIANDFDDELISMRPSAERYVYDNAKSRTSNSEELRLLYVALTRAERRLSVVTAVDFGMREKGVACTNGALLNSLLNREDTFGLRHWLEGTGKLGYAFISGICRASCASGLRHSAGFDDSEFGRIIDYSGFEVDMVGTDGLKDIDTLMKTAGEAVRDHVRTTREMPKYPEYSDTETIKTPFKVAVTGIRKTKISETTHVDLTIRDKEEYLDKLSGKITAAGKGTIVHLILQWADPEVYVNGRDALLDNVRELMNYEVFRRYDESEVLAIAEEFADGIVAFAKTDVGKALNEADKNGRAEFEKPIVFAVPSHDKAELEDFVLVQGVIDSIYEEDDGSVIVDYKTDNYGDISEAELEAKASARHAFQIDCYAASCEASGIKIKAKYLYLVRYGVLVRI